MVLRFNTSVNDHVNITWINDTIIDMYIEPTLSRKSDEDYDPTVLNFTWEVIKFQDDHLAQGYYNRG